MSIVSKILPGDHVQTPLGKGVVREVRNRGSVLVEVQGRALVMAVADLARVLPGRERPGASGEPPSPHGPVAARDGTRRAREVDLHGLTVEQALGRVEEAINEALLADVDELRLVHGRRGGRIRNALHHRLRAFSGVRGFRLDPRNAGVTIVSL